MISGWLMMITGRVDKKTGLNNHSSRARQGKPVNQKTPCRAAAIAGTTLIFSRKNLLHNIFLCHEISKEGNLTLSNVAFWSLCKVFDLKEEESSKTIHVDILYHYQYANINWCNILPIYANINWCWQSMLTGWDGKSWKRTLKKAALQQVSTRQYI